MAERVMAVLGLVGAAGVVWAGALVILLGVGMLHPPRMTDGKAVVRLRRLSPADLGLAFETVTFHVRDSANGLSLKLAGWWLGSDQPSNRTAVLLHGYADAKVGAIAWAPLFLACGLNVLAIDLRAHGESGGRHCTAGFFERSDISQVIDELRATRSGDTRHIILFGASMGAAVALAVASDRRDIAAVVLDSPYTDFRQALAARARRRGLPGGVILVAALRLAEKLSGARFAAVQPVEMQKAVTAPLLVILPEEDYLMSDDVRRDFVASLRQGSSAGARECWIVPNAPHLNALEVEPKEYASRVSAFLKASTSAAGIAGLA